MTTADLTPSNGPTAVDAGFALLSEAFGLKEAQRPSPAVEPEPIRADLTREDAAKLFACWHAWSLRPGIAETAGALENQIQRVAKVLGTTATALREWLIHTPPSLGLSLRLVPPRYGIEYGGWCVVHVCPRRSNRTVCGREVDPADLHPLSDPAVVNCPVCARWLAKQGGSGRAMTLERTPENAHDAAVKLLDRLDQRGATPPLAFGIGSLDSALRGGLRPGLAILSGKPGIGKTAFGLQMALRTAHEQSVIYLTADQAPEHIIARVLGGETGRSPTALLDGDPGAILAAREVLDDLPLANIYVLGDRPGAKGSVAVLGAHVKQVSNQCGLSPLLVIDYLQKLVAPGSMQRTDVRSTVRQCSSELLRLVRESDLSALVISSMSRAAYTKEPSLEAFKESGDIEFDADLAMVLAPQATEGSAKPDPSRPELWIVKNRLGQLARRPHPPHFRRQAGFLRTAGQTMMVGVTLRCLFCGRRPVELHHVTGRASPDGEYLDPLLVVPLCKRHHDREQELVRRQRLEFAPPGTDLLGHRRARLLDFMYRCGDHGRPFALAGASLEGLERLLVEAIATSSCPDRDDKLV